MSRTVNLKVSVSGVRGIVGESLTPGLVANFAAAFGEYVGGGRVLVGRDTRMTGSMFENAVIAGLLSTGCRPEILGVVPTPTLQIAVHSSRANGGIIISASHNTIEWNALKFVGRSGIFLNHTEASELLDIYNQQERGYVTESEYREIHFFNGGFSLHKERIFKNIDVDLIRKKHFKVALDCCNGAGAPFAPEFLQELGCEVNSIFTETDGTFHRSPEPSKENLGELSKLVQENKCDVGFAQDPDADRLAVMDSTGKCVGEQYSLALAIQHILARRKGTVVVNLDTTKAVDFIAKKAGVDLFFSKIGEINVTSEMISRNAVAGGEGGSGGIIWPAVHPCRDSFSGMALILELMETSGKSISSLISELPELYFTRKKATTSGTAQSREILRHIKNKYSYMNPITVDGVRIDWPDRWVLIRASNTEPIIRITAEAPTLAESEALSSAFLGEIDKYCGK